MPDDRIDQLIAELERILPPVFARSKIDRYFGGLFTPGYLATLDSEGNGPEGSIRCGRHVAYQKKPFLDWLRKRMTTPEQRRGVKVPSKKDSANTLLHCLHEYSK